jgi:hypothetical protein
MDYPQFSQALRLHVEHWLQASRLPANAEGR